MLRISGVFWLAACFLLASSARATTMLDVPLSEMSARASIVCRATVIDSTASWYGDHEAVVTRTRIRVTELLKGTAHARPSQELVVMETGGVVDGVGQYVPGQARFVPGEDVVVFLEPARKDFGTWVLRTMSASKFLVTEIAGEKVQLERDVSNLTFVHRNSGGRLVPLETPPVSTITLNALRALVHSSKAGR